MGSKEKSGKRPLHEYPARTVATDLYASFGIDTRGLNALHYLDDNTLISASGNTVMFIDIPSGKTSFMPGDDFGGVGCVCVHPQRRWFVVGQKGPNPNVLVYEYPSKMLTNTMKNGAIQGFGACSFNAKGTMLATVAIEPDYVLTIWNWQQEKIILRNKAFGSDVFTVRFSPTNEGMLVTSGLGHIKFWSMAETFTGLKLQGEIGKFGRSDISDIAGQIAFPDGKVVSGSESGYLLLWEGNLIKCEIGQTSENPEDRKPCHAGNIEVVELLENGKVVMSAGHDGYIRYWSYEDFDAAEHEEGDNFVALKCIKELFIGENIRIKSLSLSPDHTKWAVMSGNGEVLEVPYWTYENIMSTIPENKKYTPGAKPSILEFSAGSVNCVDTSPVNHTCVTGADDGTIRLVDYLRKTEIYRSKFSAGVTFCRFLDTSIDPQGRTLVCGFANGCLRILRASREYFELLGVWKPHTAKIAAIAYTSDFTKIYTFGADGTAFFFSAEMTDGNAPKVEPVGYCELPGMPRSACWYPDGKSCLVGLQDGNIIALDPPNKASINHDETYLYKGKWSGLGYRQKMKPPEKEKRRNAEGELEEESSDEEDLLEDDMHDPGPWGVNFIVALPHEAFAIALQHPELCYEYVANVTYEDAVGPPPLPPSGLEPPGRVEEPMRNVAYRDTITTCGTVSRSKKFLVLGCEKGQVLIRPMDALEKCLHCKQLHDGLHGQITGATLSYDDSVLLTAGNDGMLFVHSIEGKEVPGTEEAVAVSRLPVGGKSVDDIGVADAPSIQQQKELDDQRSAEDKAEGKRQALMQRIRLVQQQYDELLAENEKREGGAKLDAEDMELDPALTKLLSDTVAERVADAKVELEWTSAQKEALLKKMRAYFVDPIEVEKSMLHGFENGVSVSSFRTRRFTEEQKKHIETIQGLVVGDLPKPGDDGTESSIEGDAPGSQQLGETGELLQSAQSGKSEQYPGTPQADAPLHSDPQVDTLLSADMTLKSGTQGTKKGHEKAPVKSQLEKAEERKRERLERQQGYRELMDRRPKDSQEDPADIEEIRRAEQHMGDYILKTQDGYVIPEHLRPTAERKMKQLILLEHSEHQLRMDFNQRFYAMRDLKKRMCESVNKDRARIREINDILKIQEGDIEPAELDEDELPENRFVVTRDELAKFESDQAKAKKRAEALERAKKGFGADLASGEPDAEEEEEEPASIVQPTKSTLGKLQRRASTALTAKDRMEVELRGRMDNIKPSELEEEELQISRERLQHEKSRLERRVAKTIRTFDESLDELHHEKLKLEADLQMAEMRLLLLFRELHLLSDFKKRDQELAKKLEEKRLEKQDVVNKSQLCQEKLDAKFVEIEALMQKGIALRNEFTQAVSHVPEAAKMLEKIFRRKVKRARKNENEEEEGDSATSSEDDFIEDEEEDFLDGEEETCPAGCDDATFEEILALREQRLDQDEILQDFNKAMEQLKKENDQLMKRERTVDTSLKTVEKEIHQFQNEKQKQLNLLETIVVLKMHQIQCLTQYNKLPRKEDGIVVFTTDGMKSLQQRIEDLEAEKARLRSSFDSLRHEHAARMRKKAKKEQEVDAWKNKVYEVQLLKFGQKVDLERLENVAVDRAVEELKAALKIEEIKWQRELNKQSARLVKVKQQQQQRISENSQLLKELGSLREEQHKLEEMLNESTQRVVAKMSGGSKVATAADRSHLKDLVVAQQQEIDALKNEIAMLRRKGGHVYTPVIQRTGNQ